MRKAKITLRCVAAQYAATGERIIEFSHETGGGLISFQPDSNGRLRVELYALDRTVFVYVPVKNSIQRTHVRQADPREHKAEG